MDFFHGVQVAVMVALMTNIVQFAYWNVEKKRKMMVEERNGQKKMVKATHWYMYRPVYILMVSTVLVCMQPVCMLVIGSWKCDGQFTSDQIDLTQITWFDNKTVYLSAFPMGVYNGSGFYSLTDGNASGTYLPNGTFSVADYLNTANYDSLNGDFFVDGCSPSMQNFFFDGGDTNALYPNTSTGWCIQIFGTYLGFLLMFVGVCQATLLHVKIMKRWSDLRR